MQEVPGLVPSGLFGRRSRRVRWTARHFAVAVYGFGVIAPAIGAAAPPESSLQVTGMTFVGSRAGEREVLLQSRLARLLPESSRAELIDVSAVVSEPDRSRSFEMTCERVELDIESNDFFAEGDVRGETGDGQRYSAAWVRYQHADGLLYTDAPVTMQDPSGSFRGDGFRYHVHERRFELLGNVRVEQRP